MEIHIALAITTLLISPAASQFCGRITTEDLGDTSAPSGEGLIAAILAARSPADSNLQIQLLEYNLVCEASAGQRGEFRFVSLVAEYSRNGSITQSQFEFSCQSGTGGDNEWGIEVSGSTDQTVATPPDAALNTTLRRDCYQCLSPERPGSSSNNPEHCLECNSNCIGQLMCATAFSCCNFFAPSGDCVSACPSNSNSADSFDCECLPGFTGDFCGTDIDECSPNPCRNSGNCTDGINSFSCECDLGYTGMTCSEPIGDCGGDGDCENGGTCMRNTSGFFTCQCTNGFSGSLCQDVVTSARCGESCFIAIIVVVVVLGVLLTIVTIIASVVAVVARGKKKGSHKVTRRRKKRNQKEARTAPLSKNRAKEAFSEDPVIPVTTQPFGDHVAGGTEPVADHVTSSSDRNPDPHFESGDVITELPITTSTFGQHVKGGPVVETGPTTPTKDNISMEMSDL